ncbi:hypothetical protein BG004_007613 [Podila humilis]|nr:hypothetical protein BG004_007613 [Podila humilis]
MNRQQQFARPVPRGMQNQMQQVSYRPPRPYQFQNQLQQNQYQHHTLYQPAQITRPSPHLPEGTKLSKGWRAPSMGPAFSPQALQTFAPRQLGFSPDAAMVPIQSLQPEKAFVRVSGRTVRPSSVKALPDKNDSGKTQWLQTFTIKDDLDTIDVSFWHKTSEHLQMWSGIVLDQVVHIWTDTVKPKKPSFGNHASAPSATTSPFALNLSEGKVGHKIELGNEQEQASLFKTALGTNPGGAISAMSISQITGALDSLGGQRVNEASVVNTKNGPSTKRTVAVVDAQGQSASITLWGENMSSMADSWTAMESSPQLSIYASRLQITIGYQTHIQLNPICKNVEWARQFASHCATLPNELNPAMDTIGVQTSQIQSCYRIIDISDRCDNLGFLETVYGFIYAVICELNIDNRGDQLTNKCPSCKETITSFKIEACPACHVTPPKEDSWQYNLSRSISFMDSTAELTHPNVPSATIADLLCLPPHEFARMSMVERTKLKRQLFLERFKVYFKIACSETGGRQARVHILTIEQARLPEIVSGSYV